MLDDYSQMEKKPNGRSVQPASKTGGTESKKSLGLNTISKPFGKHNKRRDPIFYPCPKNEPRKKSKDVYADKRPRPHSQYYNCRKEDSKVTDDDKAEYGLENIHGRRNWNHLLNFQYPSREITKNNFNWSQSPPKCFQKYKHKYNKELFLQANCQFVVKQNADYTPHFFDPDLLVDWSQIEQIRLQSNALVSCPICLDIPVAAKITRCGHVYCWPCILHYLALSDKTWRKCPICYEAVHKNDLKSVITLAHSAYIVNQEITFKLMKRERDSLLPIPVEESSRKVVSGFLSLTETAIDITYSKLLLAKPEDVMSIVRNERMELNAQLIDNEGCPEICFIEQALELLKERENIIQKCLEEVKIEEQKNTDACLASKFDASIIIQDDIGKTRHESYKSEESVTSEDDYPNIDAEDLEISINAAKPFYFYQASDGQHVYLHAINVRMLEMQYGSLEKCPHQIRGKILEKEGGSMTKGLRKKLRYLQHLPLTCQFEVAEINIAPYVSDEILENFKDQIEARIKRRNRREREERKREKKINAEMSIIWGMKPEPRLRIESLEQFPLCGSGSEEVFPEFSRSSSESSLGSRRNSFNSLSSVETPTMESVFGPPSTTVAATTSSQEHIGPSFAQMLKEGTAKTKPKSEFISKCKVDNRTSQRFTTVDSESESGDYMPVPNFSQSFSDAIAEALERADTFEGDKFGKKKKKKKQKILFVTGMACSTK